MKNKIKLALLFCIISLGKINNIEAQGIGIPLNTYSYDILDRWGILYPEYNGIFNEMKYFNRRDAVQLALQIDSLEGDLSNRSRQDLRYIFNDNNEFLSPTENPTTLSGKNETGLKKVYVDSTSQFYYLESSEQNASMSSERYSTNSKPLLKYFYRTPANFFEFSTKGFYIKVNPIFDINYGKDGQESSFLLTNTKGAEIRGGIDDRVYFYTSLVETQTSFPSYVNTFINDRQAVPGAGFYKNYQSSVLKKWSGYDYNIANGYIGFNVTRHIGVQFGYGNMFLGNGYRSLLLSDFSNNLLYLKLNTRIWKFHYQNIFGELAAKGSRDDEGDALIPKKFIAAHTLSIKPFKNLTLSAFEAIIFSRSQQFELHYLNPIIFLRSIEGGLGSKDNALLGFNADWVIGKRVSLYGQLILDEFKFDELISNNRGWWANKYGVQLGAKYINAFGVDHLDLQAEYNVVRPFTYSHNDSLGGYTHYNQPLAHPLGSNFREMIFKARYPILPKLVAELTVIKAMQGENNPTENWGAYPLLPNLTRVQDYDNTIGQGTKADILQAKLHMAYQVYHNIFFDLQYYYRKKESQDITRNQSNQIISLGFRMNMGLKKLSF